MQLNRRQADRIFRILRAVSKRSTHHIAGTIVLDENRSLQAHYSHSSGDFPLRMAHSFRRSLHLTVEEFQLLRDGKMTRREYLNVVLPRLGRLDD